MEELELREKIYKRLGLDFGSLPSESGNDWQKAKNEILEEKRQNDFEKIKYLNKIDYLTIDKESHDYQSIINSKAMCFQIFKITISQRNDLTGNEILELIKDGNKDILINISKNKNLKNEHINLIIENSVYLAKKNLIEYQNLTDDQRRRLVELMNNNRNIYQDLINSIS
ncbi:hypothetical protein ACOL3J_04945 [Aliarcobacter butzleri]